MTRRAEQGLEAEGERTGTSASERPASEASDADRPEGLEARDPGEAALHALAAAAGVQSTYQDGTKKWRVAPDDALRKVLAALGLPADDAATARRSLAGLRRARVRPGVTDVVVSWDGDPVPVRIRLPPDERDATIGLRILFEDGGERDWTHTPDPRRAVILHAEGTWSVAYDIVLPGGLPFGYHSLEVRVGEDIHRAHLICAPRQAASSEGKEWGVFVPTYALHREDGFGVGDLTDLGRIAEWVQEQGGNIVATLPLLDTFLSGSIVDPSPYSPISRRFWSGLLVDPAAEPEYDAPEVRRVRDDPEFQRELEAVRATPVVDHGRVWRLKARLFHAMAQTLEITDSSRRRKFHAFLRRHPDVERYARFRAATEAHGPWRDWPEDAQQGDLSGLDIDPQLVRMHAYVEWIADRQVAWVAERAQQEADNDADERPPMRLHLDLPLGAHPLGYDNWNDRQAYADGIETGAPPDGFFEKGQKWGFSPLNPRRLRQSGYRHFAACLRHHLRHSTILRIDHVMGLHRLFWVPTGSEATDGAYVHYAHEEVYAVVLLEAHRAGALVVGEDLGTVPRSVHESMDAHHLHRTYVLQLQARSGNGAPPTPTDNSLATINTHDMVPFAAWWRGDDIQQRVDRGFIDEDGAEEARARREQTKARLSKGIKVPAKGPGALDNPDETLPEDTAKARDKALRFLFSGPAPLAVINLEDLWLETAPQNQPGFGPDSPEGKKNWARRTRLPMETLVNEPTIRTFLRDLSRTRSTPPEGDEPE